MRHNPRLPKFPPPSSRFAPSLVLHLLLISCFIPPGYLHAQSAGPYYPGRPGEWETRRPDDVGMNAESLQKAVDFAMAHECSGPRDLRVAISDSFEPDNTIVGPTKERGGPAGMIIKNGYIVAEAPAGLRHRQI